MEIEQQKVLDLMHGIKEVFGDVEFRITLPDGMKLRTRMFRCKEGSTEIVPHVFKKVVAKKK